MTTNLKKMTPNLMVEDVNSTLAFYKDVLNFELLATVPETGQFNWAMMRRDNVERFRTNDLENLRSSNGHDLGRRC